MPVPAGPIPKVIVWLADRVDVAFLVQGLRRDLGVAVAPDDVVEDLGRALFGLERAGHRFDRPRRDVVALLDQLDHLVDDGRRLGDVVGLALERQHVAAQVQVGVEPLAQAAQHGVLRARQLGGDGVVEGQLPACQVSGTQLLAHRGADPLAVGPAADLRHQRRHHLAHLLLLGGAGLGQSPRRPAAANSSSESCWGR